MFPRETLFMYMKGKHGNINADHVVLIEQRDWSVSSAHVTIYYIYVVICGGVSPLTRDTECSPEVVL